MLKKKLEENWNVTLSSTPVASAAWGGDKTSAGREQPSQEQKQPGAGTGARRSQEH